METAYDLEKNVARMALRFHVGTVPRPPHWSGFRVVPHLIEFWRGRPFRLHERIVFSRERETAPWTVERLFP